jgi:uncharacterized protein (TIGR02996 family)
MVALMDRVVAARKLIGDLVKADQIVVRRVEIVGRDLAKLLETQPRPPSGEALGEWLEEHPQVEELSAGAAALDELVDRYLHDPATAAVVTQARDAELEAQLREDPTNVTAYSVYADWLAERGDPLGELIALGIASASGNDNDIARFERHLKRHQAYFLGEAATDLTARVRLEWRFGFVQAIEALGDLEADVWQRILGSRVCELLEVITVRQPCSDAVANAIASTAPVSMRTMTVTVIGALPLSLVRRPLKSLVLGTTTRELEIDTLPPALERLELRVLHVLAPRAPLTVRELSILGTDENLATLTRTSLPELTHLTIELVRFTRAVTEVLAALAAPALTHLTLRSGKLDLPTLQCLADLPLAGRLRSLGLVALGLVDESIAALVATCRFAALEQIDLSHNELTKTGIETAQALAPTVTSTRQLRRGSSIEKAVRRFAGAAITAAEQIADPTAWRRAGIDGDIRWARYRGAVDYELFVAEDLSRFGCTCESNASPCEHVVALALIAGRALLPNARSNGIETRVTSRAGLTGLLLASLDTNDD